MQSSRRAPFTCLMVSTFALFALCERNNEAQAQATNSAAHTQSQSQTRKPVPQPAQSKSAKTDALERALRQKMTELNGQTNAATVLSPVVPPAQSATAAAPKPTVATPVAPAPPPVAAAPVAAAAVSTQAQSTSPPPPDVVLPVGASAASMEKARAALHQKMTDLNTQDTGTAAPPAAATVAAPVTEAPPAERVVVVTGNPSGTVVTDTARDATVKAAVQDSLAANQSRPTSTAEPGAAPGSSAQFAPINAPPLPITLSKDQRLQALLREYQLDQISPEQYHDQRAKILAEP